MMVNIDFNGRKKAIQRVAPRQIVSSVNLSGEAMRQHEHLMSYRRRAEELEANLKSAMDSLSSANKDIDRLNSEIVVLRDEVARLNEELSAHRDDGAQQLVSQQKTKRVRKPKDQQSQEVLPAAD